MISEGNFLKTPQCFVLTPNECFVMLTKCPIVLLQAGTSVQSGLMGRTDERGNLTSAGMAQTLHLLRQWPLGQHQTCFFPPFFLLGNLGCFVALRIPCFPQLHQTEMRPKLTLSLKSMLSSTNRSLYCFKQLCVLFFFSGTNHGPRL